MKRLYVLGFSGLVLGAAATSYNVQASEPTMPEAMQTNSEITVYKSPSCGCCADWAEHLEKNGFTVEVESVDNMQAIKKKYEIPREMVSCHTAVIEGIVVRY